MSNKDSQVTDENLFKRRHHKKNSSLLLLTDAMTEIIVLLTVAEVHSGRQHILGKQVDETAE